MLRSQRRSRQNQEQLRKKLLNYGAHHLASVEMIHSHRSRNIVSNVSRQNFLAELGQQRRSWTHYIVKVGDGALYRNNQKLNNRTQTGNKPTSAMPTHSSWQLNYACQAAANYWCRKLLILFSELVPNVRGSKEMDPLTLQETVGLNT